MTIFEAVLAVSAVALCWFVLNVAIRDLKKKDKTGLGLPFEYYESEKGWWKKW